MADRTDTPADDSGVGGGASTGPSAFSRLVDLWWLWAIAALVAGAVTSAAAQGFPIIELELAGTAQRADEVVRGANLDAVRATILWDFLFILFYAPALFFGSLWARRQFTGARGRKAGSAVAIGGLVAGALDLIENVAMIGYLNGWGGLGDWMPLAAVVAIPKFIFALLAVVYILVGMFLAVGRRITGRR